jgi:hypothetical protein
MRGGFGKRGVIHRWWQSGLAAALWLGALWPLEVSALNWEGHDRFFQEAQPIEELTEGVPPPLTKPLPDCAELRRKHEVNSYEQVALPGMNCTEKKM